MNLLTWIVEGSKGNLYTVTLGDAHWSCTCPARKEECRHIRAVRQLQKLALLDKAAVDTLEQLAKAEDERQEEEDPFARTGYQPEPISCAARNADERMGTIGDIN